MQRYRNRSGNSGVLAYEIEGDSITIQFTGEPYDYLYTVKSAGKYNIQQMKMLAERGRGLATFINKYVRNKYESKSR